MNYTSALLIRQPVPELQEHGIVAPTPKRTPESGEESIVYLGLLWGHRRLLSRVAVYALTSTLIAFLISARYESTSPF